jgi:hypothetical protein
MLKRFWFWLKGLFGFAPPCDHRPLTTQSGTVPDARLSPNVPIVGAPTGILNTEDKERRRRVWHADSARTTGPLDELPDAVQDLLEDAIEDAADAVIEQYESTQVDTTTGTGPARQRFEIEEPLPPAEAKALHELNDATKWMDPILQTAAENRQFEEDRRTIEVPDPEAEAIVVELSVAERMGNLSNQAHNLMEAVKNGATYTEPTPAAEETEVEEVDEEQQRFADILNEGSTVTLNNPTDAQPVATKTQSPDSWGTPMVPSGLYGGAYSSQPDLLPEAETHPTKSPFVDPVYVPEPVPTPVRAEEAYRAPEPEPCRAPDPEPYRAPEPSYSPPSPSPSYDSSPSYSSSSDSGSSSYDSGSSGGSSGGSDW